MSEAMSDLSIWNPLGETSLSSPMSSLATTKDFPGTQDREIF